MPPGEGFPPARGKAAAARTTWLESCATYGGEGFRARTGTHAEDVRQGRVWSRCGVASEVRPLREVLLARPGGELAFDDPPDRWLMLERIDLEAITAEAEAIARYYETQGVKVHWYVPPALPPPNLMFMRDVFFMTPEGAVLARLGASQRAGEERFGAHALASIGVPILATMRGEATFEGADALWLDDRTVLVGVGRRTNRSAVLQLKRLLRDLGASVIAVPMPAGVQHLLGVVNFVDRDLAVLRRDKAPSALRRVLAERAVRTVDLDTSDEITRGKAMNFVTVAPRHVVMPAGNPSTRRRLESDGIHCDEVCVEQYLRAAGGLGCLTGILRREAPLD